MTDRGEDWSRRQFVGGVTSAVTAGLLGLHAEQLAAEPPETTRLRLVRTTSTCWAPQYVAENFLRAEGFTEVTYLEMAVGIPGSKP